MDNRPIAPGALTPAQIYRRAAERITTAAARLALCITITAALLALINI